MNAALTIVPEGPGIARLTIPNAAGQASQPLTVVFPTSPGTPACIPVDIHPAPNGRDLILLLDADAISLTIEAGNPYQLRIPELDLTTTLIWPEIPSRRSSARTVINTDSPKTSPLPVADPLPDNPFTPPKDPLPEEPLAAASEQPASSPEPPSKPLEPTTRHQLSSSPTRSWLGVGFLVAFILLIAGGGLYFFLSEDEEAPPPSTAQLTPPVAKPVAKPAATSSAPPPVTLDKLSVKEVIARAPNASSIGQEGIRRLKGTQKDDGLLLLETAANKGDSVAMLELAKLYDPVGFKPGGPIPAPDFRESARYYRDAAKAGDNQAIQLRAKLHEFLEQEDKKGNLSAQLALKDFWP
ncbi:SEL1-like repeat protein [Entomobacter blattae]|uniref:Sel1 repeat family protein n=1 Tax=Entomobacter blattae TaxID=2762277 RepID=A0A7H1NQC7_9PROT|nr:hypothetical protein [Entomobacter blattae]QNT77987.1 hypothetical protein JGUZn3_07520 [Entomobacter blattae]